MAMARVSEEGVRALGLRERFSQLRPSRKLAVVLGLGSGLALLAAGLGARHYVKHDPDFCLSCHQPSEGLSAGPNGAHQSLGCDSCHEVDFVQGAHQYLLGQFGDPKSSTAHGGPGPSSCNDCHLSSEVSKVQIPETLGHQTHVLGGPKLDCAQCHGTGSHDVAPNADGCQQCHDDVVIREPAMAKMPCLSCHNFLAKRSMTARSPAFDCQRCHGGQEQTDASPQVGLTIPATEISEGMVHGNVYACRLCHDPHAADPEERRAGRACVRCHGDVTAESGNNSNPAHRACTSCHQPHQPRAAVVHACARCHEEARPQVVEATTAAKHTGCVACHQAHEFSAERVDCRTCHQPQTDLLANRSEESHGWCGNCHEPHEEKSEHRACANCHQGTAGHAHPACATCHEPHGDKSATKTCTACHGAAAVALQAGNDSHRGSCGSCHNTHAPAGASTSCGRCHSQQGSAAAVAGNDAHQQCGSCHEPHGFTAASGTEACQKCHQQPASGSHKGDCRQCHQAHGPPSIEGNEACAKCHADAAAGAGKHADCRSCHGAHQPASQAASCSLCHAGKSNAVQGWNAASQHSTCENCHQPHQPRGGAACSSCHAKQAASAQGSKHACATCHDVHQSPGNWWAGCNNCHGDKQAAVSNRGPTHKQCASCHQPHTAAVPDCRSCHSDATRLGAHAIAEHGACRKCHASHSRSRPNRSTCLSCHDDMTDHQPDAKTCQSCHLFR
jgi:hypothetical protein